MKMIRKLLSVVLALAMLLSIAGMALAQTADGTYEGVAQGMGGDVKVSRLSRRIVTAHVWSVAPELAGGSPVFFLDVVHDDIDCARIAFQGFAGGFRNGFGQFAFLFHGAAFKELDIDGWHDVSSNE